MDFLIDFLDGAASAVVTAIKHAPTVMMEPAMNIEIRDMVILEKLLVNGVPVVANIPVPHPGSLLAVQAERDNKLRDSAITGFYKPYRPS